MMMVSLPPFDSDGLLPPGEYELSLDELKVSELVLGFGDPKDHPTWDAARREKLVGNLSILVRQLWTVEMNEVFIDGSFVEDKDHPNDIDGYFPCPFRQLVSGDLERELNLLDPFKIWTWDPSSRRPYRGYPKQQLPMWHQYRVELYPDYGQLTNIRDPKGINQTFPDAFRRCRRNGKPKGIIKIRNQP